MSYQADKRGYYGKFGGAYIPEMLYPNVEELRARYLEIIEDPGFQPNKRFGLDMFNVVLGIIGQLCLTILPMYIVLGMQLPLIVTLALITIIVLILKKTWWNKLDEDNETMISKPQGNKIKEHEYSI